MSLINRLLIRFLYLYRYF